MIKNYTCIICPNGCDIEVDLEGKSITRIEGALCKKGKEYIEQELTDPQRNIATSIKVKNGDFQLVSVRLNKSIPKDKIFDVMDEIKKSEIEAPVNIGDIIVKNILSLNSDVIATKNIEKVN